MDLDPEGLFRDDSDEEDDNTQERDANKEMVVYLVDASPKMFTPKMLAHVVVYGENYDQVEAEAAAAKASRGEASKKRKAITDDAASQKGAAYDWAELADNGKLKDMTAVELKSYLTAHGLPVSGKKEALISRILTHLGK